MGKFRRTLSLEHTEAALKVKVYDFSEWTRTGYVIKFKVQVTPSDRLKAYNSAVNVWRAPVQFLKDYGFDSRNPQVFLRKEDAMRKFEGIRFALIGHFSAQEDKNVYQSP